MAFKTLDAVTITGAGNTVIFRSIPVDWTIQLQHTGAPTSVILDVEGSLNGSDWVQLAQHTATAADDMFHISGKGVRYIRGNLTTLSGGTSPTVTVLLEANEHD